MISFSLTEEQKSELFNSLALLQGNPYSNYAVFRDSAIDLINKNKLPKFFRQICEDIVIDRTEKKRYCHILHNCPIDQELPIFNQNDPVNDKYQKKKTYIGEALIEVFSQLTKIPLLAYRTRNNGNFFHDVYAHNKYSNTQTQKTDGELYFHNDRTAHPVRADYIVLLGMRCHEENRIYTSYIDGRELLEYLNDEMQYILRQKYFMTPFDNYSRDSNNQQIISDTHLILENEHSFRYYDTRTTVAENAPTEAKNALLALKDAIVKASKERIQLKDGDLLCIPNQDGLHARETIEINDLQNARIRWLLKTYNFRSPESLNRFFDYYDRDLPGLVHELTVV